MVPQTSLPVSAAHHGSTRAYDSGPEEGQARHEVGQQSVRLLGLQPVRPLLHHEHCVDSLVVLSHGVVGGEDWVALLHTFRGQYFTYTPHCSSGYRGGERLSFSDSTPCRPKGSPL